MASSRCFHPPLDHLDWSKLPSCRPRQHSRLLSYGSQKTSTKQHKKHQQNATKNINGIPQKTAIGKKMPMAVFIIPPYISLPVKNLLFLQNKVGKPTRQEVIRMMYRDQFHYQGHPWPDHKYIHKRRIRTLS